MSGWDDDDWVGTPPEGRYTSDRAKPGFWWQQRAARFGFAGVLVLLALLVVMVLV